MPKLITMAVSTSACGSGSAYCASVASPLPTIGTRFTVSRPLAKMNRFTA
jgi:hypothetical protein